jgi:hypothetical protein
MRRLRPPRGCRGKKKEKNYLIKGRGFDNGRWVELGQDLVKWRSAVLVFLKLRVLLPEKWLVRLIIGEWIMRMGGGWNCVRIVSAGVLWY